MSDDLIEDVARFVVSFVQFAIDAVGLLPSFCGLLIVGKVEH